MVVGKQHLQGRKGLFDRSKSDLERHLELLEEYAAAHGYHVTRSVQEI